MPNSETNPKQKAHGKDVTLYHAMPHDLRNPLRQRVQAGLYIDTESVHTVKRATLSAHKSQKSWLDTTLGMDFYLVAMDRMSEEVDKLSVKYQYAERWRRHLRLEFSPTDKDPLADYSVVDAVYKAALETPR